MYAIHDSRQEKKRLLPCLILGLLALSLTSPAAALTGDELLVLCSGTGGSSEQKQCERYIEGVVSGIETLTTGMRILHPGESNYQPIFCVPRFTATRDLMVSTITYLKQHVESRQYDAGSEILLALQQTYPCNGG
jgi:hypothetical protein